MSEIVPSIDATALAAAQFEVDLEALAVRYEQAQTAAKAGAIEMGAALVRARDLYRYRRDERGFVAWLSERLGLPKTQAYRLIAIAEQLESFPIGKLSLSVSALAEIAGAQPEVQAEMLQRAESGQKITAREVREAQELARLPIEHQAEVLRAADPRAIATVTRERRAEVQDEKRARRQTREAELGARLQALPERRYGVILADPEWRFEAWSRESGMDRAADNHYPTSPLAAIKARGVEEIAADDAVLLLWATVPMLPHALEVMLAWGFAYKSHFVWLKDRPGTGFWNRNQHELLLVGTRGNVPAPAMGTQFRSALAYPVGEHSEKPPFAHELAESYFPSLPKIELNARRGRPGWDAWGLEAPPMESSP